MLEIYIHLIDIQWVFRLFHAQYPALHYFHYSRSYKFSGCLAICRAGINLNHDRKICEPIVAVSCLESSYLYRKPHPVSKHIAASINFGINWWGKMTQATTLILQWHGRMFSNCVLRSMLPRSLFKSTQSSGKNIIQVVIYRLLHELITQPWGSNRVSLKAYCYPSLLLWK